MPLANGKLTDEEVHTALSRLEEFWAKNGGRKPCLTCGETAFFIIPQLNGNRSDSLTPNEPHFRFPAVMVTCRNCGRLEQYLATNLGINWLMPAPPPAVSPAPPPPPLRDGLLGAAAKGGSDG